MKKIMCVTCGCSDDAEVKIINTEINEVAVISSQNEHHHHAHTSHEDTAIAHSHNHDSHHIHTHTLPYGTVITHSHSHDSISEASQIHAQVRSTTISLEQDILAKNSLIAAQNRGWFKGRNIVALNLMSSPGSGKTTLLTRTINDLKHQLSISVIEGDQETINDTNKIQDTGCKVVQINTEAVI